ncbi:phosphoribosyltransferase [Sphingomonas guangdongensis]|uniref:phosphoribosyltransferase n=1 Tax=Sphingomonas guangdongensis TaxID=1141890 RepID=UPI000BE3EFE3|nr:phosphoribosyltransferase [Sphingomonas guangdongensis]
MLLTHDADALSAWIVEHHGCTPTLGRRVGDRQALIVATDDATAALIDAHNATIVPAPAPVPVTATVETIVASNPDAAFDLFGGTKPRLQVYSRKLVSWLSTRSWTNAGKKAAIAKLKAAKQALDHNAIEAAAHDLATTLERQVGADNPNVLVTHVACGHSQRPDCFSCQIAQRVAEKLRLKFAKVFSDRFVKGVSHPKEFDKLAPIEIATLPAEALVLVIDDVATSGWHMEEALQTLRSAGKACLGFSWISGTVD